MQQVRTLHINLRPNHPFNFGWTWGDRITIAKKLAIRKNQSRLRPLIQDWEKED